MTRRRNAFTLIELMIVVAIIGVLAATAISNFRQFQLRSRISEARGNLKAIATAEAAYFSEFGVYVAAPATPAGAPTLGKRVWAGGGIVSFDLIGFIPEGAVHFTYGVDTNAANTAFTAAALGDLDNNLVFSDLGYVHPAAGAALGQASTIAPGCTGVGVFDPANPLGAFDTVGPCTALDGRTEF